MRVAICFSGQLRNVQSTHERWIKPNVIDANAEHQIDFFVHSWYDNTTVGTAYTASNNTDVVVTSKPVPDDIIQQIYTCYNPISVELERPIKFDARDYNERRLSGAVPENGISRLWSLWKANQLKKEYEAMHQFQYDVVACARFDLGYLRPFSFNLVREKGIYHPGHSPHGFNVCYAMGDSQSINQYTNLLLDYDKVYRSGVTWADELLASGYLNMLTIPIYDCDIPTQINREN